MFENYTRPKFVADFVVLLERDPLQVNYRKKPLGEPVVGWYARRDAYFWPTPHVDRNATRAVLTPIEDHGRILSEQRDHWDASMRANAVTWAENILKWGGVPKRNVTPEIVHSVVSAAHTRKAGKAPMDSGWTKVAAFATAYLESDGQANAIWDSRVSWSIVRRADALLSTVGFRKIPSWLSEIGKVPGRGGTRWSYDLHLRWPFAYRRWQSHFAATDLIREIRDEINNTIRCSSTTALEQASLWTTRDVEMVLFMDGY